MVSKAASSPERLHLTLASEHASLERVVDETQEFISAHVSDEDLAYRVVLLTTEAVTNAMEHGNQFDPSKKVVLDIVANEDHISVSVQDEGEGFDHAAIKDPLAEENLFEDRGRGIFLMEAMADEVYYEMNGSKVHIVFYRGG